MSEAPRIRKRRAEWLTRLIVAAGGVVVRLLAMTWRMDVEHGEYLAQAKRGAFIFTLWHAHLLPLLWQHRRQGFVVLISEHDDGELIARLAHTLGYRTVRGSTTRGGARALFQLIQELESGAQVAFTPDGPKGPARAFQPGALIAAHRAHAPILPLAVQCDRAWRLNSWDRFMIPKPFAKVRVLYAPLQMVAGESARDAAQQAEHFGAVLNELSGGADA